MIFMSSKISTLGCISSKIECSGFSRIAVFEHDNQERHDVDFQHGSGILALLDGTREGSYEAEF